MTANKKYSFISVFVIGRQHSGNTLLVNILGKIQIVVGEIIKVMHRIIYFERSNILSSNTREESHVLE